MPRWSFDCSRRNMANSSSSARISSGRPSPQEASSRSGSSRVNGASGASSGLVLCHVFHMSNSPRAKKLANKFVPNAMHRQEIARLLGNRLKLLTNAHDVGIDCAGRRIVLVSPHLVQQAIAAQRLPGMTQKMLEEFKFLSGQLHRVAAAKNLIAPEVDLDVAKGIALHLLRQSLGSSQYRFNAREQFANGKGLGDVVVSAELEPHHLVHFLTAGCQHDDWNRRTLGLELLAHIEPAHAWHHHVENYQIR